MSNSNNKNSYTANDIEQYKGTDAIRKRPGMYVGDTYERGFYQIVWEVFDNSVDEFLAGRAKKIRVSLSKDNSIEIEDDGAGIPSEINELTGRSALELVFSELHTGGKFDSKVYKTSAGLHGVGSKATNALSEYFEVISKRKNGIFKIEFKQGKLTQPTLKIGGNRGGITGTKIKFRPDFTIFEPANYNSLKIIERLRQASYLAKGLEITFEEEGENTQTFCYPGGLTEYIEELRGKKYKPIHDTIKVEGSFKHKKERNGEEEIDINIEIAFQYNDGFRSNRTLFYTNNLRNEGGGSHEIGFLEGLTKRLNNYCLEKKYLKNEKDGMTKDDIKEGLIAIVSIRHPDPQFTGQTKDKLNNTEVRQYTRYLVHETMERFLAENPEQAKIIANKVLLSRKARLDQQVAINQIRKKDSLVSQKLSEKLASCITKDPKKAELYIVEGSSAGGSAKMGRDRHYQAILPLKGKVINAEKNSVTHVLRNDEITALIAAIGVGIDPDLNLEKIKYYKIIIMTDADVDGAHIRVLLLTFFFRYMRELIERGFLYIAQSPLYKIENGKKVQYFFSDESKDEYIKKIENKNKLRIQRYKGLGEMNPEQLWETTMDPARRTMYQIKIKDAEEAEKIFVTLMGPEVEPRNEFIKKHALEVKNLDI